MENFVPWGLVGFAVGEHFAVELAFAFGEVAFFWGAVADCFERGVAGGAAVERLDETSIARWVVWDEFLRWWRSVVWWIIRVRRVDVPRDLESSHDQFPSWLREVDGRSHDCRS